MLLCLCLIMSGCETRKKALVGKWENHSGLTFEFFADGTCLSGSDGGTNIQDEGT